MVGTLASLGCPSESVSRIENLDISVPTGTIPVRLYVPYKEGPVSIAAPVFVFYHGGGFISGDLESHDTLLRALANRGGCIVISVGVVALKDKWRSVSELSGAIAKCG